MDIDPANESTVNDEDRCICASQKCRTLKLSSELDNILNPSIVYSTPAQPDKLWSLLAYGHTNSEHFLQELNAYRVERHCALAWPPGYVAFRCRTCSSAPTMAMCADCFRGGQHEGHDYIMFKSRSGGACDCGYSIVDESGHCRKHGKNATAHRSLENPPDDLICIAKRSMPRIIHRLVIQLRRQAIGLTNETDIYLDCLTDIVGSSAILRALMIETLLSEDTYSSQMNLLCNHHDDIVSQIAHGSRKILKRERKKLVAPKVPRASKAIKAFCDNITIKTFLDELVFWIVAYEFQQKLVCFVLGFLMDDNYKQVFARIFVNYYPQIIMCIIGGASSDTSRHLRDSQEQLSRRILQVTVQIYNDSRLTEKLCDEELTLHTIIYCLRLAIEGTSTDGLESGVLKRNPLSLFGSDGPKVVCCDNNIIRERHLNLFTEDLAIILLFDHEAERLIRDKDLLNTWLEMLCYFQTMSPYKRELNEHTPYETMPHVSIFTIEANFCSSPMWTLLHHLKSPAQLEESFSLLESIQTNLTIWLYRMGVTPSRTLDPYHMSFHIPVHRMFSATIRNLIYSQRKSSDDVYNFLVDKRKPLGDQQRACVDIDDFLRMLILHPLQAISLYHQTRCAMWTRNGLMTINQAITYVHCACCSSTIDLDMFLLRYCASKIKSPDYFLKTFMQNFHVWRSLSFLSGPVFSEHTHEVEQNHHIQPEQLVQMFEGCLVSLIQLLTLNICCNIDEREQTRQELIVMVSVADRPYSYLVDMLPERTNIDSGTDECLDALINELTDYKPAQHGSNGSLQQGCYTLKPSVWENEYNPLHVLYRYYQRKDYQQSVERFFQHSKSTGRLNHRHHPSTLWPPLRIPKAPIGNFGTIDLGPLVSCPTVVGIVFSTLYKNLYVEELPDTVMAYTIHLLELAIRRDLGESGSARDVAMDCEGDGRSFAKPKRNSSFASKFCYRELIPFAQCHGDLSKEEASIKGRTIYSLFNEEASKHEAAASDPRFFPVVRHALDLAFESTWFPFESIVDNCSVHIETVHSLPRDEFAALIQQRGENCDELANESAASDADNQQQVELATSSSTRSTESQTGWSDLNDIYLEEVDDDGDDNIEVDEDESESNARIEDERWEVEREDVLNEEEIHLLEASLDELHRTTTSRADGGFNSDAHHQQQQQQQQQQEAARMDWRVWTAEQNNNSVTASRQTLDQATNTLVNQPTADATNAEAAGGASRDLNRDDFQQLSAENLITERRAILASNPRPMIIGPLRPLALEAPTVSNSETRTIQQTSPSNSQRQHEQQQQQASLSERDIQARFMGFFQSRLDSQERPASSRNFRSRPHRGLPTAIIRRANHRAEYLHEPYLVHNPGNQIRTTQNLTARGVGGGGGGGGNVAGASASDYRDHGTRELNSYTSGRASALINRFLSSRSSQFQSTSSEHSSRRMRKEFRQHHGESIISLLLRLHAKYSGRARSYEFNETRARASLGARGECQIGDGVYFVTAVLDLICIADVGWWRARIEHLCELIWPAADRQPVGATDNSNLKPAAAPSTSSLTLDERRRLAKERQGRLMAEFARKQRAFLERYNNSDRKQQEHQASDEQPINLSSKPQLTRKDDDKSFALLAGSVGGNCSGGNCGDSGAGGTGDVGRGDGSAGNFSTNFPSEQQQQQQTGPAQYECCICGVEGPSDSTNPLGQVVLLQSSSIHGHSHLRPRTDRRLPCSEAEHLLLKEETYAKHLERRIDLFCEHFSESSWLDSINIGAEGGVHVQSCGHYLHIECHQSYIRSLDREDRLHSRDDDFLCPVCRQLANSVLPILGHEPGSQSALVAARGADERLAFIGEQLQQRVPPNHKELQSSANFCSHLTKATGPQYRLIRSNASIHSLFLFLTSIVRTNLEIGVLAAKKGTPSEQSATGSRRRTCFQLLFQVLALNAQTLIKDQWFSYDQIWSYLTCRVDEKNRLSVKPTNSIVPLLLRDPIAMLIQFLFSISKQALCDRANFACIVQTLFNLTVIQSIALVLSYTRDEKERKEEEEAAATTAKGRLCGRHSARRPDFGHLDNIKTGNGSRQDNEWDAERMQLNDDGAKFCRDYFPVESQRDEDKLLAPDDDADGDDDDGGEAPKAASCFTKTTTTTTAASAAAAAASTTNQFEKLVSVVEVSLAQLLAPNTEEPLMNSVVRSSWPKLVGSGGGSGGAAESGCRICNELQRGEFIANKVKLACMSFLRAAAFLQEHLYGRQMPELELARHDEQVTRAAAIDADFERLRECLALGLSSRPGARAATATAALEKCHQDKREISSSDSLIGALSWPTEAERLVVSWSAELLRFAQEFSIAARTLLVCRPLAWYRPALMELPRAFDDIFMFYYRQKCSLCQQVPKDIAVCLVCGAPICFRVSCCKDRSRSRQVHSQHCGANTAVFLAVHTSSIVVIRGNRACVWGSVYLDAHEEEDNGLQRGKPLYLVPARYKLLESQWLAHSFDHTCGKRWIYLQE